jgi:chemotaxis regulatin CheY-phosphate phosphatase CheZ
MPRQEDLPQDIRALVRRHAVEMTDTRWDYDVGRLVENVEQALARSPPRERFLAQVPPWD